MTAEHATRVLVTGASGFLGGHILRALMSNPAVEPVAACRKPENIAAGFSGEIRAGDLTDARYRRGLTENIDVVCHAGTWASMWRHKQLEHSRFFQPTCDLIDAALRHGVKRFIFASTVAIAAKVHDGRSIDDFAASRHTGYWPHLDRLVDVDNYMQAHSHEGMQMVTLRLGHFIGAGNRLGIVPALTPRLGAFLVPWLAGGRKRVPLVAATDLGKAFALAAVATDLQDYESFNICGTEFPSLREVISFIAAETGFPKPLYSVPYPAGYAFGWLMETLNPLLPGHPFLTRSIVHLCEDWHCPGDYAARKLGYIPTRDWRMVIREQLAAMKSAGYPWPALRQAA